MKIEERKSTYIDDDGAEHEYTELIQVNDDGTEEIRATIDVVPNNESTLEPEPEPTQLDRMEHMLNTSYTEAQNQAVDQYTEELLEGGIL